MAEVIYPRCPVCDEPEELSSYHDICSGCGTQFSYDDCVTTHAELRERWIAGGSKHWLTYAAEEMP